nr:bile acid:sodium symporter family protein [Hydrocarboniphaga sp.]
MNWYKRIPFDRFLAAMIASVALASLWPTLGASGGPLHLDLVTELGVSLVFFFAGAGLSFASLKDGVTNWRLHLLVQLSTFALFPLIGMAFVVASEDFFPRDLLSGFFFLCALPSTISTSIAMTQLARGNVAGAIFNATLSSLLGMVLTPLLVNLYLHSAGHSGGHGGSLLDQFAKIAGQLFLPLVLGQLTRRWIAGWISRNKGRVTLSDRVVILLIVYNAFSDSAAAGIWSQYGWQTLAQTFVLTAALLATVLAITRFFARRAGFKVEDEIAGVFCGSKKSLAVGVPMAKLLLGNTPLGMIVLPLMIYHQLQLFVCTLLARRYASRPALAFMPTQSRRSLDADPSTPPQAD